MNGKNQEETVGQGKEEVGKVEEAGKVKGQEKRRTD
jgi:hypothetical protein